MKMKCTSRAPWKPPNSAASGANCTGFQIARPESSIIVTANSTPQ